MPGPGFWDGGLSWVYPSSSTDRDQTPGAQRRDLMKMEFWSGGTNGCLLSHYVFGMWKKARAWIELQLEPVATTWITYHCLGDAIRNWQRPFLQIFDKWGIFIGHFHWNAPTWQQINRTMPSPVQLAKYHKLAELSRAPVGEKQMQFPEFSLCIMKTPLKG